MTEKTRLHIQDVRETLFTAQRCHEAWWLLYGGEHEKREMIVSVFNRYLYFFSTITPALYTAFVVKLASLFGNGTDEISLKSIPGIESFPEFTALWDRGRRLYKLRSKIIAHRDKNVRSRNYAFESGFTYADLKTILDDTCELFENAAKHNRIDGLNPAIPNGDLISLVEDVLRQPNQL